MPGQETDKNLPGFCNAFDLEAVKKALEESFRKNRKDVTVDSCIISDVKYEPGKQCVILYRTQLVNEYFHQKWEQLFLGKVMPKFEGAPPLHKEAIYSQALGIVFSPFPYDPSIPWLPETYSSKAMKRKLVRLFPEKEWRLKNIDIKLLAYTPHMRATFLYSIDALHKESGENRRFEWIGKTNVFKSSHRSFANYWALWKGAEGQIPMPEPTGFLIEPQIAFQKKIQGIRLGAVVDAPNIDQLMEEAARHLARFHGLQIPLSNTRKLQQETKTLNRWSDLLIGLRPDLKFRMEELRKKILKELEQRMRIEAPVHADFHHTNLLVDDSRVQIIDMDEMAYGDPCLDVGRFLSSLRIPSLRAYGSFDGLQSQRELFVETYLRHYPGDAGRIRLFEAASLFTSAASAFRLQRASWEEEVSLLLDESEQAFSQSLKQKSSSRQRQLSCPKEQCLAWARDEVYVTALLAPHVYKKKKQILLGCSLQKIDKIRGYHRLAYTASFQEGVRRLKGKIELFLHNDKERRFIYDYVKFLNSKLEGTDAEGFFPAPLAYLPEIEALVFERQDGKALTSLVGSSSAEDAVTALASSMAHLHRIPVDEHDCNRQTMCGFEAEGSDLPSQKVIAHKKKEIKPRTSYVLKTLGPASCKFSEGRSRVSFPFRKYVGHPYSDIGFFEGSLLLCGLKKGLREECEKLLDVFLSSYAEQAGAEAKELAVFRAESMLTQAGTLKGQEAAALLIERADTLLRD